MDLMKLGAYKLMRKKIFLLHLPQQVLVRLQRTRMKKINYIFINT